MQTWVTWGALSSQILPDQCEESHVCVRSDMTCIYIIWETIQLRPSCHWLLSDLKYMQTEQSCCQITTEIDAASEPFKIAGASRRHRVSDHLEQIKSNQVTNSLARKMSQLGITLTQKTAADIMVHLHTYTNTSLCLILHAQSGCVSMLSHTDTICPRVILR